MDGAILLLGPVSWVKASGTNSCPVFAQRKGTYIIACDKETGEYILMPGTFRHASGAFRDKESVRYAGR